MRSVYSIKRYNLNNKKYTHVRRHDCIELNVWQKNHTPTDKRRRRDKKVCNVYGRWFECEVRWMCVVFCSFHSFRLWYRLVCVKLKTSFIPTKANKSTQETTESVFIHGICARCNAVLWLASSSCSMFSSYTQFYVRIIFLLIVLSLFFPSFWLCCVFSRGEN